MMSIFQKFMNLRHNKRANVTIEAALVFALLSGLIITGADIGRLIVKQGILEHAARAGSQYGLRGQTDAMDLDAVENAARQSVGEDLSGVEIVAENICRCPDSGPIDCNESCSDDSYPQMFLTVQVVSFEPYLFGLSGGPQRRLEAANTLRMR